MTAGPGLAERLDVPSPATRTSPSANPRAANLNHASPSPKCGQPERTHGRGAGGGPFRRLLPGSPPELRLLDGELDRHALGEVGVPLDAGMKQIIAQSPGVRSRVRTAVSPDVAVSDSASAPS